MFVIEKLVQSKNNPAYTMVYPEPYKNGDVLVIPNGKPFLTEWIAKYDLKVGDVVEFQE